MYTTVYTTLTAAGSTVLAAASYPQDLQIFVVTDGCKEKTKNNGQ
jgi:hypothetical protein